jgi:ribosomal protein S18 acetylase RimI-like enzyme
MKTVHYTEKDSTKNKPHYTVNFFNEKDKFIGMYSIHSYYLYNVFVDKNMRKKGYCKKIVNHAVNRKKNLYLDVDPCNIGDIKCYKSCGFKFFKKLENYYNPVWGDDKPVQLIHRYKHS